MLLGSPIRMPPPTDGKEGVADDDGEEEKEVKRKKLVGWDMRRRAVGSFVGTAPAKTAVLAIMAVRTNL
jgi:hypothetical protein